MLLLHPPIYLLHDGKIPQRKYGWFLQTLLLKLCQYLIQYSSILTDRHKRAVKVLKEDYSQLTSGNRGKYDKTLYDSRITISIPASEGHRRARHVQVLSYFFLFAYKYNITHRLSQHLAALSRNSTEQGERDDGDRGVIRKM